MTQTRAGFWRRLGALLVDCIVLTAIVQVAVLVLYPVTGGRVQANGVIRFVNCQSLAQPPAGVTVPPEYAASPLQECRINMLGLEFGHYLEAAPPQTAEGGTSDDPWTLRLDRSGTGTSVLSLDILVLPLLMLWRAATDGASRQTLGRKIAGLTVTTTADGSPGYGKALLRQLLLWWPSIISLPLDARTPLSGGFSVPAAGMDITTSDILGLVILVWSIIAVVMIVRRIDPLYDRWVGTKVVTPEGSAT